MLAASPSLMPLIVQSVALGAGATLLMDAWLAVLKRAGSPGMDFALLGRWAGHLLLHGRLAHAAIRQAAPVRGELGLGWLLHYAVGIVFAALLLAVQGSAWLHAPTLRPALIWGLLTTAAPLFLLQPAMGAGLASSRTATPWRNRLRSLLNHLVFGLGLYLSALALAALRG
jgi:Protein of unknown function (DUF2938)